jgi:hypothetical protein
MALVGKILKGWCKMKRVIILGSVAVCLMMMVTGCASIYSANCTRDELSTKRIMASGDEGAIRALNLGVSPRKALQAIQMRPIASANGEIQGMTFGVDIANMDVIRAHPWRTTGAALLDGLGTYGVYLLGDEILGDGNNSSKNTTTSTEYTSGGDIIIIHGDGDTVDTSSSDPTDPSSSIYSN